jgi:hypothetical protein
MHFSRYVVVSKLRPTVVEIGFKRVAHLGRALPAERGVTLQRAMDDGGQSRVDVGPVRF